MRTLPLRRPHTVAASVLLSLGALLTGVSAQASVIGAEAQALPRALLRPAKGDYVLDDGRVVTVQLRAKQLDVRVQDGPFEPWHSQGPDLLVSPDGQRRLRLFREADGSVDRVALETDRVR
jgi:hypothetical protein